MESGADLLGEALELLQDGLDARPRKVEDQVAHAQALVRADVLDDLIPRADERDAGARLLALRELDRCAEGQGDRLGIAAPRLGLGAEVGSRLRVLLRVET